MNIVVIGLGSMGKRRVRLLRQYVRKTNHSDWILVGVDSNSKRREECSKCYEIDTFGTLYDAQKQYKLDAAIISTSPLSHAEIIKECLNENLHVFSELNLVDDGYAENQMLAEKRNRVLFLSSTFLYRKEIQYIKNAVDKNLFAGTYNYHVGQYLPAWHPWESYKNFFVGDRRTNACREIFAIELPWLTMCFGNICEVYSRHKKISKLDINYDDCYQVILVHETGIIGTLVVDVATPRTGRTLELWQENFCVTWKGTPDTLEEYNTITNKMETVTLYDEVESLDGYHDYIIENAYYDELVNFLCTVIGKDTPKYSFEKDASILKIIDRIEE